MITNENHDPAMCSTVMQRITVERPKNVHSLTERPVGLRFSLEREIPFDNFEVPSPSPPMFRGIIPFLASVIQYVLFWMALMTVSLVSYGLCYYWIMPATIASESLYFDYSTPHLYRPLLQPFTSQTPEKQFLPKASLDLFARHATWDAFHDSVLPTPRVSTRLLRPGRAYAIEMFLVLPDSPFNQHRSGMFTIYTEFISSNGTRLAVSKRSHRYPHRTPWIANVRTLLRLIPILLGTVEETSVVTSSSFRHYAESLELPLQHIHVLVEGMRQKQDEMWMRSLSSANYPSPSCVWQVEILTGQVMIHEEFKYRIQEWLHEWFWTGVLLGTHAWAMLYFLQWQLLCHVWRAVRDRNTYDSAAVYDEDYDVYNSNNSEDFYYDSVEFSYDVDFGYDWEHPCDLDLDDECNSHFDVDEHDVMEDPDSSPTRDTATRATRIAPSFSTTFLPSATETATSPLARPHHTVRRHSQRRHRHRRYRSSHCTPFHSYRQLRSNSAVDIIADDDDEEDEKVDLEEEEEDCDAWEDLYS